MTLEEMKAVDVRTVDPETLVDIRDVHIDRMLPKEERIKSFIRQIKNPYVYKCGDIIVKATFSDTDETLEDRMEHYLRKGCSTHSIQEDKLIDVVLQSVSKQVDYVCEMEKLLDIVDSLPESQMNVFNYNAQIVRLKEDIERNKSFKLKLYENLQEGMIGQDENFLLNKSYRGGFGEAS